MNSNPNPHHHHYLHHHQHLSPYPTPPPSTESKCGGPRASGGGPSCASSDNGLSYMEDCSGGSSGMVTQDHPMSHQHQPSGWGKPHQLHHHQHHHDLSVGDNCSPSSSNHGASPHNYLQQSFYPEPTHGTTTEVAPAGRVNYSPSPCSYYSPDPRGSGVEYYHQTHQAPPDFPFEHGGPKPPFEHSGSKSSNRRIGGGFSDDTTTSHMNFYAGGVGNVNFYDPQHHQYTEFQGHEYSRMNFNNNSGGGGGGGSGGGDYFTGPPPNNRLSSTCPSYGHHHVSTPLEFHQHSGSPHLQGQPITRRNSLDSLGGSEGNDFKYGYAGGTRQNSEHVKRETVIAPPWATTAPSPATEETEQYFYGGAQYSRQGSPASLGLTRHCESVPGHGTLTPPIQPSCSYDEGHYKNKQGVKQRSLSLSYSRNYECGQYHRGQGHYAGLVDPTKNVPVSSSPDLGGQGFQTDCQQVRRKVIPTPPEVTVESPSDDEDEDDAETGMEEESDESATGSSSSSSPAGSPKSSFPPSVDSNESDGDDNMSDLDLEEELKKEIQSVTTTSDGSREHPIRETEHDEQQVVNEPSRQTSTAETSKLFVEDAELSNSSLTLFDSIALNTFDSPGPPNGGRVSDTDPSVDNQLTGQCQQQRVGLSPVTKDLEDQDSLSGLSSISRHRLRPHSNCSAPVTLTLEKGQRSRPCSPSVLKGMKRSFSETDKDLLGVNSGSVMVPSSSPCPNEIQVPKGWRREIVGTSSGHSAGFVFYVSPSETKLRSLEEVRNYITSDGTCKCGLSCPLRLELAFSFDPKVINGRNLDDVEVEGTGSQRRSCCFHVQKRKIPLSEDSPLISSTRDDLGDSGEDEGRKKAGAGGKKRRTEGTESMPTTVLGTQAKSEPKLPTSDSNLIVINRTSAVTTPTTPTPNLYNQNVVIPFAQQSPDTTTQTTPQRDMSPASSISSEPSLTQGGRSTNSTPTPTGTTGVKTSPMALPPGVKGQGSEFAWPMTPTTSLVRPQTPPGSSPPNAKKSTNYQHHLISKSPTKRTPSPCPNIDVRQIPIEQNQPPPRVGQGSITPGASQGQSTSAVPPRGQMASGSGQMLSSGYSISPILSAAAAQTQFTNILQQTSASFGQDFAGLGMPRLVNSTTPILSTGVASTQVPSSVTISIVEPTASGKTIGNLPKLVQKSASSCSSRTQTSASTEQTESSGDKSPLQRVQDVVDRFHSDGGSDSSATTVGNEGENPNKNRKEPNESASTSEENMTLESKILKIIADAASASAVNANAAPAPAVIKQTEGMTKTTTIRYGNVAASSTIPASSAIPASLPLISSHPMAFQSLPQAIFTSNGTTITTTSNSAQGNVPIMTSNSILSCAPNTSSAGIIGNGNQLILQQQDANNPSLRYPIFQTLQPIFLNPGAGPTPLLIPNGTEPPSFIQIDQNNPTHAQELIHQGATMVIDPSMCGAANLMVPGPKKKKKRLSKKQQQQQAQLQLQQQLLLQQLFNHQQVQQQQHVQAAQQQIPLLLPPSFNLGPQGFLQPMNMNMNMNFFPTPTILTLPNLILNPADGTLFIQQTGPQLSSPGQQPQQPTQMQPQLKIGPPGVPLQMAQAQPNPIVLPRKDMTLAPLIPGSQLISAAGTSSEGQPIKMSGELGIDDSSRQNATPDSSTNDLQLGIGTAAVSATVVAPPTNTATPMTVSLPLGSSTNLQGTKKGPLKSKVVSSSTAPTVHKRILPQKQILPKIDSTTPSVENNN